MDETFVITEFKYEVDKASRKAKVYFRAKNESGENVGGEYSWD